MIISFLRVTALIKNPEYSNINGVFLESKGERRWFIRECKIFCVNEKIHTKKEVASVE